MAEFGNNNNTNNTTSSKFSFFNRSLTTLNSNREEKQPLQKPQNIERTVSLRGRVVKKLCSFFEPDKPPQEESLFINKLKSLKSTESTSDSSLKSSKSIVKLHGTEDRIVLYFTSLRGIRRTYEDCYAVRMILRGFRVWVDERDVSMDSSYRKELMNVLGEKSMKNVTLPQVFIRGNYVGGAEIIKQLCEVGELGKILEGFPKTKAGFVCESCGDVRFMPCGNCSGSKKIFDEDEGLLKRCLECNENGLIRCPNCCNS
jgi:glutaredoxin domain-containing cysteine-rich protein 1